MRDCICFVYVQSLFLCLKLRQENEKENTDEQLYG